MKENELMIGDVIMAVGFDEENDCDYRFPVRITAIDKYSTLGVNGDSPFMGEYINNEDSRREDYYDIEPIPLTEDILRANFAICKDATWDGLNLECNEFHFMNYKRETGRIKLFKGSDYYEPDISVKIHFVHELQHALRLCGLNELADNFKLTMEE